MGDWFEILFPGENGPWRLLLNLREVACVSRQERMVDVFPPEHRDDPRIKPVREEKRSYIYIRLRQPSDSNYDEAVSFTDTSQADAVYMALKAALEKLGNQD